jgi:hypothetical protein
MKVRHAAALALVGWYLMLPPLKLGQSGKYHPDFEVPLNQWESYQSYDDAAKCEEDKARTLIALQRVSHEFPADRSAATDAEQAVFGQCIATDDPRLKGK